MRGHRGCCVHGGCNYCKMHTHVLGGFSRARGVFPGLHSELTGLLKVTHQCAMVVVDPEAAIDEVRLNNVFRIIDECVLTLGKIEEQLMRSRGHASVVGE